MSIELQTPGGSTLEMVAQGKLEKKDYDLFIPKIEKLIEEKGKVGLLIRLEDFRGWSVAALWEDLKFDCKHYRDVSRVALVGEKESQEWMATVSKPFTAAEVKFFVEEELEEARSWAGEGTGAD